MFRQKQHRRNPHASTDQAGGPVEIDIKTIAQRSENRHGRSNSLIRQNGSASSHHFKQDANQVIFDPIDGERSSKQWVAAAAHSDHDKLTRPGGSCRLLRP